MVIASCSTTVAVGSACSVCLSCLVVLGMENERGGLVCLERRLGHHQR